MVKTAPPPSAARAALVAAVQAVRDRAAERAQTEAALALAEQDIAKSWDEIRAIESALRDRPQTVAEALLERARGHSRVTALIEQQILEEEPQSSRDLKAQLALAENILEDRRQVQNDLKKRVENFASHDYTVERAKAAARNVIREATSEYVAQKIAAIEAATVTLIQARADLTWFQSHGVFGQFDRDLPPPLREALSPYHDQFDRMSRAARAGSVWATVIDGLLADPTAPIPT